MSISSITPNLPFPETELPLPDEPVLPSKVAATPVLKSELTLTSEQVKEEVAKALSAGLFKPQEQIFEQILNSDELDDFKDQVNDSFEEISGLLIGLQGQLDLLLERLDKYNVKSSHKI